MNSRLPFFFHIEFLPDYKPVVDELILLTLDKLSLHD